MSDTLHVALMLLPSVLGAVVAALVTRLRWKHAPLRPLLAAIAGGGAGGALTALIPSWATVHGGVFSVALYYAAIGAVVGAIVGIGATLLHFAQQRS